MTAIPQSFASIILPDTQALSADQYQTTVLSTLDRFDPVDGGSASLSDDGTLALGGSYCIGIEVHEQSDYGPKIVFRVMRHDHNPSRRCRRMAMIMRHIIRQALVHSEADFVEWMEPTILLTREEFLEAVAEDNRMVLQSEIVAEGDMVIVGEDCPFNPVETDLSRLFSNLPPATAEPTSALPSLIGNSDASAARRMKVATWALTSVIASISAPVAVILMVVTAIRGADFRFATQALALTGFGSALYSQGMIPGL